MNNYPLKITKFAKLPIWIGNLIQFH